MFIHRWTPYRIVREDKTTPDEPTVGWYFKDSQYIVWGPYFSRKDALERSREEKQLQGEQM